MAGSIYDSMGSPYAFRDDEDRKAERQNRLDLATINAISKVRGTPSAPGAAPGAPGGDAPPTPEQMGVKPLATAMRGAMQQTTATPAPAPEGIQDFANFIRNSNPMEAALRARTAQAATDQLDNPAAAFDAGAAIAREDQDIAQRNTRERSRDELAMAYGGNASQTLEGLRDVEQQGILDRRTLNRDLTAGRQAAVQSGMAGAIQNALGLIGIGSQEKLTREGMAFSREERLGSEDFQSREAERGRTSTERIAYAGLDLERDKFQAADANQRRGLDLEASAQAMTRTGMDREEAYRYAALSQAKSLAEKGLTLEEIQLDLSRQRMQDENARYYAGLASQERQQTLELEGRLKVAQMQIGSTERLQASQERHQTALAERDAVLQKELQERGLEANTAIQRSQMDFDSLMADKGFLNVRELEELKQDFAAELQREGFSQERAMQAAELQARAFEAESDRRFNAEQADLTRRFSTSERVGSETFARSLQGLEAQQEERMARLNQALGLETADRQYAYQRALAEAQQVHEQALQGGRIGAEQAMRLADQVFQERMQREGFTQEQTMQATALHHEAAQTDKQLQQQYSMFFAEQAQEDTQFRQELGLREEQIGLERARFVEEMGLAQDRLGIEREQWESLKTDQAFQREVELAMMGIQMWDGGDPAAIQPFAERLAKTMGTALGMDSERLQEAITANFNASAGAATEGTTRAAFSSFDQILDTKGGFVSEKAGEDLKTAIKSTASQLEAATPGKFGDIDRYLGSGFQGADFDAAGRALLEQGYTKDEVLKQVASKVVGEFSKHREYNGTPEFVTYAMYTKLKSSGLSAEDAKDALTALVGEERAQAGLSLERSGQP